MKLLKELKIKQSFIALFGSGNSIHDLSAEDFELIKSQAFVWTMNYAPLRLQGHLNMWSDKRVADFMDKHYASNPKECLFLARKNRFGNSLKEQIDYCFSRRDDQLKGNFTLVWALQLIQKYFPEKTILLFGVDMYTENSQQAKWYDQYTNYDQKSRGRNYNIDHKLAQCNKQIRQYCKQDKVFNCNLKSRLDYFEKKNWKNLLRMKVLHLCSSSLAGAPSHLSKILNKYSPFESKSLLKADFTNKNINNLKWDYDVKSPASSQLKALCEWADLVHFHGKEYPLPFEVGINVLQYHSPPRGYQARNTHAKFNGRKMVIAQYHPRFYTDAYIVPNLIDIWDAMYLPAEKSAEIIKIFYSWATEKKGGWSDKGSAETIKILKQVKKKYGDKVEIVVMNNQPYDKCMAEKRTAHICIDECVTGSYHLQSLEGCSIGAVTFNNIDQQTISFIKTVTGQATHPFEKANLKELFNKLVAFIDDREQLFQRGIASRNWMERHWNPAKLVYRYIRAYQQVYLYGRITPTVSTSAIASPKPGIKIQRKPLTQQKSKTPAPEIVINESKTRSYTDLYQQFKGEDIYIFGCGPSLLNIDPEVYQDKVCFSINYAFEFMPYMDYYFIHVMETYEVIHKIVDNTKLILPETLVRQWYREKAKNIKPSRIKPDNKEVILYPCQNPYEKNIKNKLIYLDKNAKIFTWSSTSHSAIHMAAYMGAKRIFLLGMDYQLFANGKVHFNSKYDASYGKQNWNANFKHKQGEEWLSQQLVKNNIQLVNLSKKLSVSRAALSKNG